MFARFRRRRASSSLVISTTSYRYRDRRIAPDAPRSIDGLAHTNVRNAGAHEGNENSPRHLDRCTLRSNYGRANITATTSMEHRAPRWMFEFPSFAFCYIPFDVYCAPLSIVRKFSTRRDVGGIMHFSGMGKTGGDVSHVRRIISFSRRISRRRI